MDIYVFKGILGDGEISLHCGAGIFASDYGDLIAGRMVALHNPRNLRTMLGL